MHLFRVMFSFWWIFFLGCPVTNELGLFLAYHFNFDVRGLDWGSYFDKDLAIDNVSWLIEWEFSLQLYSARREHAARICEVLHYNY